jgi:DnaJ family protein C protein 11
VQEAYEVLNDPGKRDIYDIYGMQGLMSGMELSNVSGMSAAEMRKEWERKWEAQRRQDIEASVNFRGQYVYKIDASALVAPYARNVARTPDLVSMSMTTGVDVPIDGSKDWGPLLGSDQDVLHLGGFVYSRGGAGGGGSFLAGYRRLYAGHSRHTTVDVQAAVGLRSLLSVSTTVQLTPYDTGTLSLNWQPRRGFGLQVSSMRQLGEATTGEFSWVAYPPEESGMTLNLVHRPSEETQITGRLEVGTNTALILRIAHKFTDHRDQDQDQDHASSENFTTARAGIRVGFERSFEVDVGGVRKLSEASTGGVSVLTSLGRGVTLRLRYSRAGHSFEFPILLSPILDVKVIAAAHLVPPIILFLASRLLTPIRQAIETRRKKAELCRQSAEIAGVRRMATSAARLMEPVARRRVGATEKNTAVLVAVAMYGEEKVVKEGGDRFLREAAASVGLSCSQEEQEEEETLIQAYIDVTTAVQYLCENGRIRFHKGYSKSGLMGFCDPCPSMPKLLLVFYTYGGKSYKATISDTDGASLPSSGKLLDGDGTETGSQAQMVEAIARARWSILPEQNV